MPFICNTVYVVHLISNTSANPEQASRQNIVKNPCWASIGCNEYGRGAAASSVDQVLHLRIIWIHTLESGTMYVRGRLTR